MIQTNTTKNTLDNSIIRDADYIVSQEFVKEGLVFTDYKNPLATITVTLKDKILYAAQKIRSHTKYARKEIDITDVFAKPNRKGEPIEPTEICVKGKLIPIAAVYSSYPDHNLNVPAISSVRIYDSQKDKYSGIITDLCQNAEKTYSKLFGMDWKIKISNGN